MPSITRKTQSSRADRRGQISAKLLAAVERLVDEDETYTELSVERLVNEADVSRSTFYTYFEDKGDLLSSLTESVIAGLLDAASHWWSLPADASKDDLRDALQRIVDAYLPHQVVMGAVIESASYDARVREQFGVMLQRSIDEVAAHIADGQRNGFIHADLDPQRTSVWLTWMTERGLYQLVAPAKKAEVERLLTSLTDLVWNVLYAGTR